MSHVVRTACTRDCADACQILATVEGDRVVSLKGDPAHPITRGFLCHRTDHYLDRQYSPERLLTPLMRRPGAEAGAPGLTPCSWDEALDRVALELRQALDKWGAQSIFHYQSGGSLGLLKMMNRHFFELLGPVTHKRGDVCTGAGDAAQMADMGLEDAHDLDDLENSRAIFLWGKNVAETGVHLIPHLKRARARGATIVGIDPIYNKKNAALCHRTFPICPGGDGFLALGMARALFDDERIEASAIETCDGFAAYSDLAHRNSVERWAALADLAPEDVRFLADLYADKPAALFVGWGLGRRLHGSATVRALDALGAITGNLGIAGGGVSYYFPRRQGFDTSFVKLSKNAGARTILEPLLGEEVLRADPPIRACVIDNGNPVSQLPDSKTVARGLRSIDFVVVLDAFLNDTAELADVVLPTTTMLEEHDVVGAYGHHYVQLAQPVVAPPAGVRSDLHIYQALADRLGFGEKMSGSPESFIDRMLKPMESGGVTREKLLQSALRKPDAPRVLFADKTFPTSSGRFQLLDDFPAMPPSLEEGYPLHLMSISTFKNQSSQISRASQIATLPVVTLHPEAALGFGDGDQAMLVSPIARVRVRLRIDASLRSDVVVYPKGRWGSLGGPNSLIRARPTDHGGGAAYYDQGVRIERPVDATDEHGHPTPIVASAK